MKMRNSILIGATLLLLLPTLSWACPLCADAIANSPDDVDANNLPAAINQGIYLMVSVPYLTLGIVGFLIYRGYRKNQDYLYGERGAFAPDS